MLVSSSSSPSEINYCCPNCGNKLTTLKREETPAPNIWHVYCTHCFDPAMRNGASGISLREATQQLNQKHNEKSRN